jgi:hypothetical protein
VATALVALAAFFRPDIERLSQRRRALVDVHPAGRLEVGFSSFGPTLGLQGTMQAINRDEFISYSRATVERVADNLRHEFPWAVFRPQSFSATQQQTFEIASGFLLSIAAPRRFNIQFHDSATADNFRQSLIDLQRLWMAYLQAEGIVLATVPAAHMRGIYDTFHQAHLQEITPLFSLIDRQFYWTQGTYRLLLELQTSRPTKTFTFSYTFTLSDSESNSLRSNCISCLLNMCNVPDVIFNFVYPTYSRA